MIKYTVRQLKKLGESQIFNFCEITGYDIDELLNSEDSEIYEMSDSEYKRFREV